MSVILQPYQAIPFSTSLDFQISRSGGSLCTFENLIDEGDFLPFAIISPDQNIGEINLFDCDDNWLQSLSLTISSEQNVETGLWFHYYNGDDFGLSCGTYYITIVIGDFIWYSEQFTIRNIVNASDYPELIKDEYHLPLRIYDSITKQLNNKTSIGCELQPLNPISSIMPFMFDTEEDINELSVFLVDACTEEETDLSADIELEFIKENPGDIEEQEILTTSQQLRTEFYEFDTDNFIIQEFKINDTGELKNIQFEWLFNNTSQTITIDLILGTNPSSTPVITKIITDNSATSKELTLDYSSDNIPVTSGEIYLLKFATDAPCTAGIGVNNTKVYPDGRFGERNTIPLFKEQSAGTISGIYTNADVNRPVFTEAPEAECYGSIVTPLNPATYSFRYTASENQAVRITTSSFQYTVNAVIVLRATVDLVIKHNSTVLYSYSFTHFADDTFNIPNQTLYAQLSIGDNISLEYSIISDLPGQSFSFASKINIDVYLYGQVILGLWFPIGFIPVGLNYQNKSAWFYVFITKEVYVGGSGATKIYNPGRPLPSPLICGNYYLKLVSNLHTWYSEWFRIINVGEIDLVNYVLGTEDGEIIITEDSEIIEIE